MIEEIWKDVVGYEGLYQISNLGNVKSLERITNNNHVVKEKILKYQINQHGYITVGLYKDCKQKTIMVHRLIAQAFIPNPENKPQVDHINTIRNDNRIENLRWVTNRENINNPITLQRKSEIRTGCVYSQETTFRMSNSLKGLFIGGKNPRAKKVFCDGVIFDCAKDCADTYEVNNGTLRCWLRGDNPMPQKFKDLGLKYIA